MIIKGPKHIARFDGLGAAISRTKNQYETIKKNQNNSPTPIVTGGSMSFDGTATSYLTVGNDANMKLVNGDFTIEWFQYQTDNHSNPRIFSIGTYPSAEIGVSIEGGTFYFWASSTAISFGSAGSYKNQWVHFAITRNGTNLRLFKNGTQLGTTVSNSTNFNNSSTAIVIGNETTKTLNSAFGGLITNFHWDRGEAKYTSDFSPITSPLTNSINKTELLLLATNQAGVITDSSSRNRTLTNSNVTWSSSTPFSS